MGFGFGVSSPRCNCALETVCSSAASKGCEAHVALTLPAAAVEEGPLLRCRKVLEHNNNCITSVLSYTKCRQYCVHECA